MGLDLYLINGRLVVFIQSDTIKADGSAEEMLLPFWPPLGERGGGEGHNLPIG